MRANDLPLSNNLKAWLDNSVDRAFDVQSQTSWVRIPLGSASFLHFHFSICIKLPLRLLIDGPAHLLICPEVMQNAY